MPGVITFDGDCLIVLRRSLAKVAPEEGCALLIGHPPKSLDFRKQNVWLIKRIWPCCNVWAPEMLQEERSGELENILSDQNEATRVHLSKLNRFALDPKEQLKAQKWARANYLQVLGVAHSHPDGDAVPSLIDLKWGLSPGLMLILDKYGTMGAWWKSDEKRLRAVSISGLDKK